MLRAFIVCATCLLLASCNRVGQTEQTLGRPTLNAAAASQQAVTLACDQSPGATGYRFKTAPAKTGPWTMLADLPVPTASLSVDGSKIAYFAATAYVSGSESDLSNVIPVINTLDVLAIRGHYLGFIVLPNPALGDVNEDHVVNSIDVIGCQRFFLGLTSSIAHTAQPRAFGILGDVQ